MIRPARRNKALGTPAVNLPHWVSAAGLAVVLVGSQFWLRWVTEGLTHQTATAFVAVLPLVVSLVVATALLLVWARRLVDLPATPLVLAGIVVTGLAMRLVWFGAAAPLEDDFYRYLWDGAVVAHGLDPYAHPPLAFLSGAAPPGYAAVAAQGQDVLARINFPDLRTIYPGTAQLAFAVAHWIAPFDIEGLRLVFVVAETAAVLALFALARLIGVSPVLSGLYFCNPLVAYTVIGTAHVDALIPVFVAGAILLAARDRPAGAGVLLALAAGVKIWPAVLAPVILWRLRAEPRRMIAVASVVAVGLAAVLGPVVWSAIAPQSGLTAYATGWSNNNAPFTWVVTVLTDMVGRPAAGQIARGAVVVVIGMLVLWILARGVTSARDFVNASVVLSAAVFYLSPAQFPWYTIWFLPLAALVGYWPLLLASATIPVYYLFFPFWDRGLGSVFFHWIALAHVVPVAAWVLWDLRQPRDRCRGWKPADGANRDR